MKILPYKNFETILMEISAIKKVSFEKKNSWESTLISLLRTCRILKTLELDFNKNRGRYNLVYKTKIFYRANTISFEYDKLNYTIKVFTGLTFGSDDMEIRNQPINFDVLEFEFKALIKSMESEYPRVRSKELKDYLLELSKAD